jgi:hypothetical protein
MSPVEAWPSIATPTRGRHVDGGVSSSAVEEISPSVGVRLRHPEAPAVLPLNRFPQVCSYIGQRIIGNINKDD